MAVQTKAGLQAQRIAGTQSDGCDALIGEQATRESLRSITGKRDFETVFSGIA